MNPSSSCRRETYSIQQRSRHRNVQSIIYPFDALAVPAGKCGVSLRQSEASIRGKSKLTFERRPRAELSRLFLDPPYLGSRFPHPKVRAFVSWRRHFPGALQEQAQWTAVQSSYKLHRRQILAGLLWCTEHARRTLGQGDKQAEPSIV